jgi:hypothetical protein
MPATRGPLCLRLPDDMHAAVHQLAEQQGVSTSEWIRDLIFRTVYGEPLGISEGYFAGRAIGFKVMHRLLGMIRVPQTVEEAMSFLQSLTSPGRTPHDGT